MLSLRSRLGSGLATLLVTTILLIVAFVGRVDAQANSSAPPAQVSATPEFRAFWVDGFNDGFITPSQCDQLIARVRGAHCNAIFVQARKRGDAYYWSHYEPWATDDTEHFDALAYLCSIAHAPGKPYIQVHAWINATTVGGRHNTRGIAATHPEWRSLSDTGDNYDGEAAKIDPGNPAAADWTYRVYLDIVRHYPVDGIHMDFIRYGGSGKTAGHWGYNPVSVSRFVASRNYNAPPAWNDPAWQQWRRDQVTALVRRIYLSAVALRPNIIVSAATICWGDGPADDAGYEQKSAAYNDVYADWRSWMREGILDVNFPMTYVDESRHPDFWTHWTVFVKDHQYDHLSAMGIGAWMNAIPSTIQQIQDTRTPDAAGNRAAGVSIFSYASTDTTDKTEDQYNDAFYTALDAPEVFGADVPTPSLPWKDHPTKGYIDGVALAADGLAPLDGATVTLAGVTHLCVRTTTADGNGFWGFVDVHPGKYTVAVNYRSETVQAASAAVVPGRVTFVEPGVPGRAVAGSGSLVDGTKVTYIDAIVTSGSDRLGNHFFIAQNFGKPALQVNAPGLIPPTVAGDRVAIAGVLHYVASMPVVDAVAVRNLGAVLITPPDN